MERIYLDNNATTPILPEVAEAMHACLLRGHANPASQHEDGRRARRVLESAREAIGEILGADVNSSNPDRLIFTSGGTESNNLALFGLCGQASGRLLYSSIEHPSVVEPAQQIARGGRVLREIRVTQDGVLDLNHLETLLSQPTRLVSVMLGNNETGALQPVREAATLCRQAGALMHTDAVQVVGKLPLTFRALGVDALSLTAHKFHGPKGIGALIVRAGVPVEPIMFGGFQQMGLRCGTECVALAVGLQKALEAWQSEADERAARMARLRVRLETALLQAVPGAVIHSAHAARLPHTTNISFPGVDRQALLIALDMAGLSCSTGSACASGSSEPSPVLAAMAVESGLIEGSIRLSLGATTTEDQIAEATHRISLAAEKLRR